MDLDPELVKRINTLLAQTGERERLKELLKSYLTQAGWDERVKQECQSNHVNFIERGT